MSSPDPWADAQRLVDQCLATYDLDTPSASTSPPDPPAGRSAPVG